MFLGAKTKPTTEKPRKLEERLTPKPSPSLVSSRSNPESNTSPSVIERAMTNWSAGLLTVAIMT
jgi:hypothetical protein